MIRLYNFSCKFISYLMIVILSVLTAFSLVSTTFVDLYDRVYYIGDSVFFHCLTIIALAAAVYLFNAKVKFRVTDRMLIFTLAIMTVLSVVFITVMKLPPRFDQREVWSTAGDLLVGIKDDFQPGGYAQIYPYNHGITLFYRVLMGFMGFDGYIVTQYINLVFMVMTVLGFYFVLKHITPCFREATLGLILFMPYWGYATFLYGNIPGFCFGMWSLYFGFRFLEEYRIYQALVSSFLMTIAFRFKEHFAILVIAMSITVVCVLLKSRRIRGLLLIVSMLLFLYISGIAMDKVFSSIADYIPSNGIPSLPYIAMGLHEHAERGAGWHDNYPEDTYEETGHDPERTNELAVEDIKASIDNFVSHPQYMLGFFARKIASMWNEPTYYSWTLQQGRDSGRDASLFLPLMEWVYYFNDTMQSILYFFALIYFWRHRNDTEFLPLFFALFFIGGFLCHIVWEAASQYALFYSMGITIYAALGIAEVYHAISVWDMKKTSKAVLIAMIAGMILSVRIIPSVLTLDRDNARYEEYMSKIGHGEK